MLRYSVVLFALIPALAIEVMLERWEQMSGADTIDCQLRVRKINRTTAALFGNVTFKTNIDNSYKIVALASHSPLGNNQFNLYPMKVGPIAFCDFNRIFWPDFYPYGEKYVTNLWKPYQCPIRPSQLFFNDLILDAKMFPPYFPPGLWKADIEIWKNKKTVVKARFMFKVYFSGYFG